MKAADITSNRSLTSKQKVQALADAVIAEAVDINELAQLAAGSNSTGKATCVEALELVTRQQPGSSNSKIFDFATKSLSDDAPRVKWESAKVIGNIAHLFPARLSKAIAALLDNTEHEGTVVRWAAAFALGEILKLNTKHNKELLPAIEAICKTEENNGVRKKYLDAIKKSKR